MSTRCRCVHTIYPRTDLIQRDRSGSSLLLSVGSWKAWVAWMETRVHWISFTGPGSSGCSWRRTQGCKAKFAPKAAATISYLFPETGSNLQ
ncbi:unnamed protein product [Haemonchus placei]|uniref:Uncharacterized protein n=1 Tax=Haemonchus placei TaxID=6290 RepID=A0A0N4WVW9_HAEPC|nr:unnamed protein product [Haemonchus placei]